ncbi:MAG: hypothetical protein R3B54_07470 [Bdellovibrionota bacterium]
MRARERRPYCAVSNGYSFSTPTYWTSAFSNAGGWASQEYYCYWRTIRLVDVTGDGIADVCGRASGGMYCALSNGINFINVGHWTPAFSNASGWSSESYYWATIRFRT